MNVTLFSTTNCVIYHMEMQWLDKQGITYDKKVVDEDESAMGEFMQVNDGMFGTPFTVIENNGAVTKIAGFDQPKFKAALSL